MIGRRGGKVTFVSNVSGEKFRRIMKRERTMTLDDDQVGLLLDVLRWVRSSAPTSDGTIGYGCASVLGAFALQKFDELIAAVEQERTDRENGDA